MPHLWERRGIEVFLMVRGLSLLQNVPVRNYSLFTILCIETLKLNYIFIYTQFVKYKQVELYLIKIKINNTLPHFTIMTINDEMIFQSI